MDQRPNPLHKLRPSFGGNAREVVNDLTDTAEWDDLTVRLDEEISRIANKQLWLATVANRRRLESIERWLKAHEASKARTRGRHAAPRTSRLSCYRRRTIMTGLAGAALLVAGLAATAALLLRALLA